MTASRRSRPRLPHSKLVADLLRRAQAYCERTGMSKARLATIVAKDGKFFDRIEDGENPGDCTTRMYERFIEYFDHHQAD